MQIDYNEGVYFAKCTFEERLLFRQAGWVFSARNKRWETSSDSLANLFLDSAVGMARERLVNIQLVTQGLIAASSAVDSDEEFWSPEGKHYLGYQKAGISFLLATKFALLADAPGVGKGQRLTDRVLSNRGWITLAELQIGDLVASSDGKYYPVSGKYYRGVLPTYKFTFNDSTSLVVDTEHLWKVKNKRYTNRDGGRSESPWKEVDSKTLYNKFLDGGFNKTRPRIPLCDSTFGTTDVDVPLDPYVLGCLLGDGGIKYRTMFSNIDDDIIKRFSSRLPSSVALRVASKGNYRVSKIDRTCNRNPVTQVLKDLGVFGLGSEHKFIPSTYMNMSHKQMLELLYGLMDTDGYVSKNGSAVQFSSNSKVLCEGVVEICRRFGGLVSVTSKISTSGKPHFLATIRLNFCPFTCSRKVMRYRSTYREKLITRIQPHTPQEIVCISVESPDRTYVTEDCIVTHNTIQILGVVNNSTVKSVLIIAPASLKYNWLKESKRWLRDDLTVGITDTHVQTKTKTKEAARTHLWPDTDVVITTYDMLEEYSTQIHAKTWDLVACDEAHVLSNKQAQRTKRVLGGGKGKKKILPIPALRMIFATGTPILKKPINLWPIVEKCDPMGIGKDYMEFVMRYCGGYHNSYGLFKDGATNLEELQIKMRSKFMVRRLKADVLKDLPPKNRQVFELPPEGLKRVVRKELEVFERNLAALHSQNTGEKLDELTDASAEEIVKFIDGVREASRTYGEIDLEDYMKIHFEAMALAREEVGMAKVPMVVEYVKRIVDDGQKVVVMTFHKTVAETLLKEFPGAAFVTGKVPAKKRQDEVDRFQEDPDCMVFIGNIAAAGVGLTLTAAYNLVFAEFSWSPAEMEQAEDRIHRIGQENHAHIHYLVVRGSIEAAVINILIEKQEIIEQALNINKLVDIR